MSMITEQTKMLRDRAKGCQAIGDFVTAEIFRNAADTIEQLAAKTRAENKTVSSDCISRQDVLELMNRYWSDWDMNGDDAMQESMNHIRHLPSVEPVSNSDKLTAYQKAFEDIRAEISSNMGYLGKADKDKRLKMALSIIDKHDPSKAGKPTYYHDTEHDADIEWGEDKHTSGKENE